MKKFTHRLDVEEVEAPVFEFLPDGRIVINSIEMGEITVETNSHGRVRIIVEETAKEDYKSMVAELKAKRSRQDLLDLMEGEANDFSSDFS